MTRFVCSICFLITVVFSSSVHALIYFPLGGEELNRHVGFEPTELFVGVVGQTQSLLLSAEAEPSSLSKLRRIGVVIREPSEGGRKVFERLNYRIHDFSFFRSSHPADIHLRLKSYLWPEVIHFIRKSPNISELRVSLIFEVEGGHTFSAELRNSEKWLVLGAGIDDAVKSAEVFGWLKKSGASCVGLLTTKVKSLFKAAASDAQ